LRWETKKPGTVAGAGYQFYFRVPSIPSVAWLLKLLPPRSRTSRQKNRPRGRFQHSQQTQKLPVVSPIEGLVTVILSTSGM
jgi:hypothetical protein